MDADHDVLVDEAWLRANLPTSAQRHAAKIAAALRAKDGWVDTTEDLKAFTSLEVSMIPSLTHALPYSLPCCRIGFSLNVRVASRSHALSVLPW